MDDLHKIAISKRTGKPLRKPRGKPFVSGNCANPGGRPAGLAEKVRAATKNGELLIDVWIRELASNNVRARLDASRELASRGWGAPRQEVTGADGEALVIEIRKSK